MEDLPIKDNGLIGDEELIVPSEIPIAPVMVEAKRFKNSGLYIINSVCSIIPNSNIREDGLHPFNFSGITGYHDNISKLITETYWKTKLNPKLIIDTNKFGLLPFLFAADYTHHFLGFDFPLYKRAVSDLKNIHKDDYVKVTHLEIAIDNVKDLGGLDFLVSKGDLRFVSNKPDNVYFPSDKLISSCFSSDASRNFVSDYK